METNTQIDDEVIDRLLKTARDFATRAYVPYSGFPVGSAVLTADGSIIGGVNIENASYGLTVCGDPGGGSERAESERNNAVRGLSTGDERVQAC